MTDETRYYRATVSRVITQKAEVVVSLEKESQLAESGILEAVEALACEGGVEWEIDPPPRYDEELNRDHFFGRIFG